MNRFALSAAPLAALLVRAALLLALTGLAAPAGATLLVGSDTLQGTPYTIYVEPAHPGWRFACQTPCPIPLATLQAAANGFVAAKAQLLTLAGLDTLPALRPVDIFFEANTVCPLYPGAAGYASVYQPYGSAPGQPMRAFACLFLWNYQQNGDIDYFTPEAAGLPSSQTLIVHEYAHSLFFLRHRFSYEDFVRYWSYVISGEVPLPQGACSEQLITYMAPMIPALCRQFGAGNDDFRFAMERIDTLYQQNLGYHGGETSLAQLRAAFDERLAADTRSLFLDLGYRVQQVGGSHSPIPIGSNPPQYLYDFRMPGDRFLLFGAGFLSAPVKLEQPSCLPTAPFLEFALGFDLVQPAHRENAPLPAPAFGGGLTLFYSFAGHTPRPGVNPANYRFYRATAGCGQAGIGWQEYPATINLANQSVTATVVQGGTYALMQPDRILRSGFE